MIAALRILILPFLLVYFLILFLFLLLVGSVMWVCTGYLHMNLDFPTMK